MSELNKAKLYLILTVMVSFTLINVINSNNWIGYLLSLVVLPSVTWLVIEFIIKYREK